MSAIEKRLLTLTVEPTVPEVAKALHVTGATVRRWAREGYLPRLVKMGPRKRYFLREELLEHVRSGKLAGSVAV